MLPAKQDVITMIDQLPEQQLHKIVNYILILKNQKQHKELGNTVIRSRKYDFSDLAGKLEWNGDAVAEQRRLRDEW